MKPSFIAGALIIPFASLASAWAETVQNRAEPKAQPQTTAVAPLVRTLIDRDSLRSIEVVTDRRESISQFFARQRLALAIWPVLDGKQVGDPSQFAGTKTRSMFVSYPLFNDEGFKLSLYGEFFELQPLAPAVLALLRDKASPQSERTLFIIAPGPRRQGNAPSQARIVGRIQVLGSWLPSNKDESLSFVPSPPSS